MTQLTIREVSRLTGIPAVTLRAWERRYGLLRPHRSEKGYRLYREEDLLIIRQVQNWLARGVSVSKAASLLAENESQAMEIVASEWKLRCDRGWHALSQFNVQQFHNGILTVLKEYPLEVILSQFLQLLAHRLSQQQTAFAGRSVPFGTVS